MIIRVPDYVAKELDGLRKKDFHIQTLKGSGPGGQHRNKRETGIRITHKKTGIAAVETGHKSQLRNRQAAFIRLAFRMVAYYTAEMRPRSDIVDLEVSNETIRTYNFQRHTVKDHRSGVTANLEQVLEGDLDVFH